MSNKKSNKPVKINSKYKLWYRDAGGKIHTRYSFPVEDRKLSSYEICLRMRNRILLQLENGNFTNARLYSSETGNLLYIITTKGEIKEPKSNLKK